MGLCRLWRLLWTPGPRVAAGVLVLAGIGLAVALLGGYSAAVRFTNRTEFCISCHEMRDTVYQEYLGSVHYKNASGVRAGCPDCHVPRPWLAELRDKVRASGELYHSAIGTISTPEKFETHRLELAKSVWASMAASDSRECRNCHAYEAMDAHKQRKEAGERMQKAAADGETCINCHKGIAHHLPDMSQGFKQSFAALQAESAATSARPGDVLYPLQTRPLWVAKPDSATAPADGRLLAATPVTVLKAEGDWLQVEIGGWQQQGAERMIYALQGRRIFAAALGAPAVEAVKQGEAMTDKDTDQVWSPAMLTAWIGKDDLTPDIGKLWAYGEEMYGAACGTCHSPTPTTHYLANQWIGTLNSMRQRVSLDDEQMRFIQKYLQLHAQDTGSK